jgi:hypothetical protein
MKITPTPWVIIICPDHHKKESTAALTGWGNTHSSLALGELAPTLVVGTMVKNPKFDLNYF